LPPCNILPSSDQAEQSEPSQDIVNPHAIGVFYFL